MDTVDRVDEQNEMTQLQFDAAVAALSFRRCIGVDGFEDIITGKWAGGYVLHRKRGRLFLETLERLKKKRKMWAISEARIPGRAERNERLREKAAQRIGVTLTKV